LNLAAHVLARALASYYDNRSTDLLDIRGYLYAAIRWSRTPDAAAGDERNRFACDGASRGDPISRPINPLGTYEAPQFYALK
jgi:hypothetical protein